MNIVTKIWIKKNSVILKHCHACTNMQNNMHPKIYLYLLVWMCTWKQILQEQNCHIEENVAFSISNPRLRKNFLNFRTAFRSRWKLFCESVFYNFCIPKIPETFSISKFSLFIKYFDFTISQYFSLFVSFFTFLNVRMK